MLVLLMKARRRGVEVDAKNGGGFTAVERLLQNTGITRNFELALKD